MLRLLLIALFALPALASENFPRLIGTWRSDREATNAYLEKHAKLTELQKKAFAAFFGKSVVTFKADGSGTIFLPARTMPKKDGGHLELLIRPLNTICPVKRHKRPKDAGKGCE